MEGTVEAMEAMEAMEATEDTTTARGPLMLRLRLSPPPLPSLDTTAILTDTEPTDTVMLLLTPTDIITPMARGLLMPSPDMVGTTAIMGTEVTTEDIMATVATEDTTTARGLLMLSPDTATTVTGT